MTRSEEPSPGPRTHEVAASGAGRRDPSGAGRGPGSAAPRGIAGLPGGRRGKYVLAVLWLVMIAIGGTVASAEAVIYLLAAHTGLTVNSQNSGILTVLVLGAGTGYALLLIARYRAELRRHADRHEAMAAAIRRARPAIMASAATAGAGMLCLLAAKSNATRGLGAVAAIGIGVSLLAVITLLPALLVICGRWAFWQLRPRYGSARWSRPGIPGRRGRSGDHARPCHRAHPGYRPVDVAARCALAVHGNAGGPAAGTGSGEPRGVTVEFLP